MNVRTFAALCSVFLSLLLPPELRSDNIRMLDGTLLDGSILSADTRSVVIRTAGGDLILLKPMMSLITFTSADRVVTTRSDTIDCKIVSRQDTLYTAVTVLGPVVVNESTIKEIRFNTGGELKVKHLPATDSYFHSSPTPSPGGGHRYYAAIGAGFHGVSLANSLILRSPSNSSSNGLLYNIEFGSMFSPAFSFGLGYESFGSGTIPVTYGTSTSASYEFVFGTLKFGGALTAASPVYIFGAFDLGFFTVGHGAPPSAFISTDQRPEGTMNFRVRFGGRYEFTDLFSYTMEVRLLTGSRASSSFGYDFQGFGASFGFEFHFGGPFGR